MNIRLRSLLVLLTAFSALLWLPGQAQAQFSFTLTSASVTGAPGGPDLTFFGTLSNSGTTTLLSGKDPHFNLDTGPAGVDLTTFPVFLGSFFAPDTLAPGTTATIPIFSVTVDPSAPLGEYTGNFSLSYGKQASGQEVTVNVAAPQAVPEASSSLLLGVGLLSLGILLLRRRSVARV